MSGGALETSFNSMPVQSGAMSSGSTDTGAGPFGTEVRLSKKPRPARKSYAGSAASALDTKVRMEASAVEAAASAAAAKAERFASERRMQRAAAAEASGAPPATKRSREEDTSDIDNGGGLSSDADATLAPDELKKKRYQRRLELNRQSAAVSRVRRREYVKELEEKLVSVEKEKFKLQSQVDLMGDENSRLRTQMKNLQTQMGKPPAGEQARAPRGSRGSGNSRRSSGTQ
jgi:bZIP transcription factor